MIVVLPFRKILLYTKFIIFALLWKGDASIDVKFKLLKKYKLMSFVNFDTTIRRLNGSYNVYKKDDYHFDSIQRKLITVNKKSILETQLSLKLREIWQMILNLSLNYAFRRVYFLVWHDFLSKKLK